MHSKNSKERLIKAVGTLIVREGFSKLGINSVAKEAGVDKVLIYRYFGGMEGLLQEFSQRQDFFRSFYNSLVESDEGSDLQSLVSSFFVDLYDLMDRNEEIKEIMRWELSSKNALTTAISAKREKNSRTVLRYIEKNYKTGNHIDLPAIGAILIAGIFYLNLRGKTAELFGGINLKSDEGKNRLKNAIKDILGHVVKDFEKKSSTGQ